MHHSSAVASINPKVLNILAKQQHELMTKPPHGVIFHPNADDIMDLQADIVGPTDTPYENGTFHCRLVIDGEFPQKPPKGYFLTKIFHPNVAVPSGEICVNTLKKDWNPSSWSLSNIFEVIKCLLIVPFPESSLNEEAGRLFMEDYDEFFKRAKIYTGVHARNKQIASHHHKEEHKMEEHAPSENQQNCNIQANSHPNKELGVLNQVTNSFVPSQSDFKFAVQDGSQAQAPILKPKKATVAADAKKKWMRRI